MKKLILFGDSLFGRCNKRRVLMLEEKLNNKYDVYNCATGGWDSNDLVKKAPYIVSLKPDIMIISVGTNDVCDWKKVELADYITNLGKVLDTLQPVKVVLFPPPPVHEASRPSDQQILNSEVKKYADAAMAICKERGLSYVDSWKLFLPLQDREESYHIKDGVHLNDHGYEVLFDEIAKVLQS